MRKHLLFKCLLGILLCIFHGTGFGQNASGNLSPNGTFEKVYDRFGTEYALKDLAVSPVKSQTLCLSTGYFNLWFENGSGFEQNTPTQNARRNVLCQLFNDLSNFIGAANPQQKVNIWVRDINAIVPSSAFSGVLGLATSFYTMPSGAPAVTGIVDGEVWKTIHTGYDSYTNVAPPLYTAGGPALGFYHGMVAFNFNNTSINWHTALNTTTSANLYDLYSVGLHEITHALGFASLIDGNGQSKIASAGYNYYSRYDMFLQTSAGQPLIANTGTCSLYNFAFNPVVPVSAIAPGGACITDNTTCGTAVKFAGSVNQPVYTPNCFEPPSSLSHLEDQCHLPLNYANNSYYVMSNANGMGSAYMKRYLKEEERKVLCDLGYSVNTVYGNNLNPANQYTYTGAVCPGMQIGGINDGINNGFFNFEISVGQAAFIPGAFILYNDYNAVGFECLEDVYGNGLVNITSGIGTSMIQYTATAGGTALLRYIPVNAAGQKGNITYIFIRVNSGNCYADPCNMVVNGEFESVFPNCAGDIGNSINCWSTYASSPELHGRNCNFAYEDIPSQKSNPFSETWDNGANNNNHFLGLFGYYNTASLYADNEAVQTLLTAPLVNGNAYTLRFKAKVANAAGFLNVPARIVICGSPNTLVGGGSYDITDPNLSVLIPDITVPASNTWHSMSVTFTYTGAANLSNLVMGYYADAATSSSQPRFVYVDAVELFPAPNVPLFTPITPLCVGDVLGNLAQFASPPGGTFSGPSVTNGAGGYSFTASSAGIFEVTYSYTNAIGCVINTPAQIQVNPSGPPVISVAVSSSVSCPNMPVTATVTGASNYTWTPAVVCANACSQVTLSPAVNTIYTITSSNGLGCTASNTFQISVNTNTLCCQAANVVIPNNASSSAYASLNGMIVDVVGIFNINSSAVYVNTTFRMAAGAKIVVNNVSSLTLNNCRLYSCTNMWDGIYLNQAGTSAGALIVYNGSSIEDAINGVVANSNSTSIASVIKFENSTMNKNYKSFQISNYTGSLDYSFSLKQATINCVSSASSPGANLKAPNSSQRSSTGILLNNVKKIKIGTSGNTTWMNLFNNQDYGIYSTTSGVTVVNNKFSNMGGSFPLCLAPMPPAPPPICPPLGVAILVPNTTMSTDVLTIGGTAVGEANIFQDVLRAIDIMNVNTANIVKNTFSNTSTSASFSSGTGLIGQYAVIASDVSTTLAINFNDFKNFANIVNFSRNSVNTTVYNPAVSIQSNTISSVGAGYVSSGFYVTDQVSNTISGATTIFIRNNGLSNIRDYGIRVYNIKNRPVIAGTSLYAQWIDMIYAASGLKYAIYLNNCARALVTNNHLTSTATGNTNMHGIFLQASVNSMVQCNYVNKITNGITISGDCTGPYTAATSYTSGIVANTLSDVACGIYFKSSGKVGQQGDASHPSSNIWAMPASAYISGQTRTDASSLPSLSIFYCKNAVLRWPTNHQTVGGTAYAVNTTILLASTGAEIACPGPSAIDQQPLPEEAESPGVSGRMSGAASEAASETLFAGLSIYPNPNRGVFSIQSDVELSNIKIRVVDVLGKVVLETAVQKLISQELDISFAEKGLYYVEVTDGTQVHYHKLIKQ